MDTELNWNDLRIVLAAEEAGSLQALAAVLRMDPTTVARRIDVIEQNLNVTVISRSKGSLQLTPSGMRLLSHAKDMRSAYDRLVHEADLQREVPSGTLKVSAPPTFARCVLAPNLSDFLQSHPRVEVDLSTDPANVDFGRWEADVAIRLGGTHAPDDQVMTRRLGEMSYSVFAGAQGPISENWIGYSRKYAHVPEAQWLRENVPDASIAVRSNDPVAMCALVRSGAGRAVLPDAACAGDATLVAVDESVLVREVWLLRHAESKSTAAVQAFIDWLIDTVRHVLNR